MSNGTINKGTLVKGGGSGGGGSSKVSYNIFDTKVSTIKEAQKGWSCISYPTQNKLNKADVPTAYTKIKEMLDGAEGAVASTYTAIADSNSDYSLLGFIGDYVYISVKEDGTYKTLPENIATKANWTKVSDEYVYGSYITEWIITDTTVMIKSPIADEIDDNFNLCIFNKSNFSLIKKIKLAGGRFTQLSFLNSIDGYVYFSISGSTYKIKDSINENELSVETVVATAFSYHKFDKVGNKFIFSWTYDVLYTTTDITDTTTYTAHKDIDNNNDWLGYPVVRLNNGDVVVCDKSTNKYYLTSDGETMTEITTLDTGEMNWADRANGGYIFCYRNGKCIFTTNLIDETVLLAEADYTIANWAYNGEMALYKQNYIYYAGYEATVYTDTYTIDGSSVTVKYYKNGDDKICTSDIAVGNDTNLQTVFEFLGYLNYFWIDTTNEKITLQRNSNLWTFQYVGDDYSKEVDGTLSLPTGNATRLLPQSELIEVDTASITLDILKNKVYKFTNSAITDITFSSNEDSTLPTTIKFTTGNSAPTFTDNSGINWVDGVPVFQANKTYQIIIFDNDGYIKEF